MSGDDNTPRRYDDRSRAPNPANRRHNSHGTYNSRALKSVPGLVTDPNDNFSDIDRVIQRGQQESLLRNEGRYLTPKRRNIESPPSVYRPTAITQPYFRQSLRDTYFDIDIGKAPINPVLLTFLPGLSGCGLLVTAIVLANWKVTTTADSSSLVIVYQGLFQECTSRIVEATQIANQSCVILNTFHNSGSVITMLQQATRGLVIIAAAISFISVVVSILLGIRRWERKRGAIVTGLLFTLAGLCGGGGMGCYTATLLDAINLARGITIVQAGSSFYFGWGGTGCIIIASVLALMAHCARRK